MKIVKYLLYVFCFQIANIETKKHGWPRVYSYAWFKNEQEELIPNANHNPDSGHMSACDGACLCLILHQEMPLQKAIAGSCLCILMSTPWEKYANSFCHQEENKRTGEQPIQEGLRGGGHMQEAGMGVWIHMSVMCVCWVGVCEDTMLVEPEWEDICRLHPTPNYQTYPLKIHIKNRHAKIDEYIFFFFHLFTAPNKL